jgi:hypothetical protein
MVLSRSSIALFRFVAAALIAAGIILDMINGYGVKLLFYFTIQSNIIGIVVLLWGGFSILMNERVDACPHLSYVATMSLILTGVVFWFLMAPFVKFDLLSFQNLMVHLFGPLAIIADRLLFYVGHAPSGREPFIALVHPFLYLVTTMIVGLGKFVEFQYGWFPYPFLDVYTYGVLVPIFIAILAVCITVGSFIWARIERRRAHKMVMRALTKS